MTPQEFIARLAPLAMSDMARTGVPASVKIAQAALETGWGSRVPGNNLYGIKGEGQQLNTREYVDGRWITVRDGFRVYDSWADSVADHSLFLQSNPRYRQAGFFERTAAGDYAGASRALQSAGYATDPQYAQKLISIIEQWNLAGFDEQVREELELAAELEPLRQAVQALRSRASMPVPDWARSAVNAAAAAGLIDAPEGGSYDFYRLLTVLHRKGII